MKTIKKILVALCSFVFMIMFGFALSLNLNVKAKAATGDAVDIGFQYAAVIQNSDGSKDCHFVLNNGISTPEYNYQLPIYFNDKEVTAWTNSGTFIVDYDDIGGEVGDIFTLEILANTQYQSNKYVKNDFSMLIEFTGSEHGNEIKRYDVSKIISPESYSLQLNRADWALNATSASNLYVTIIDPDNTIKSGVQTEDWENGAQYAPIGNALTVNGSSIGSSIQKVYGDPSQNAFIYIPNVSKPGDVLTFDGWFTNATYGAFRIEKTSFIYDGKSWDEVNFGVYKFEASTTSDANPQNGFYLSMQPNHIPVSKTDDGWSFGTQPVSENFYGYYNGEKKGINLRKFGSTDWYVNLNETGISAVAGDVVSFGGWYVCNEVQTSVDSDGKTVYGNLIAQHYIKIAKMSYQFDGTNWTEVTPTFEVSIDGETIEGALYVLPNQSISDVAVTASNGNEVTLNFGDAVKDGKFVLRRGESLSEYIATFSVTDCNGMIYTDTLAVYVGLDDFVMENGAAVRVDGTNVNGLRFSAEISKDTYNSLKAQGATFGMVIVPKDYITPGYELTATNLFGANAKYSSTASVGAGQVVRRMLLLDNLTPMNRDTDSNYEICGSITDIRTNNLTREFVGVAYACVNNEYILASYYGNDMENNARSIYYVSQKAIDAKDHRDAVQTKYIDTFDAYLEGLGKTYNVTYTVNYIRTSKGVTEVETETFTAPLNSKVEIDAKYYEGFTLTSFVSGISTKIYANKDNVIDFYYKDTSLPDMENVAWHHPMLDASNGYMNETNKAIAETMRDAGFNAVMMNGSATVGDVYLNSLTNIETTKKIINMFWTYGGIKTILSGKNVGDGSTSQHVSLEDYKELETEMASLADLDGFGGFFAWDEPFPKTDILERIAEYAAWFDGVYGDNATFMVNLFPSYYSDWSSGDYKSYADYIEAYCDIVLSQITNGTKYLMMDTYPVNADGTLDQTFMYDMAVLKYYALEYGAEVNTILQACGWDSETHDKAPNEAQYRLMYYTALAFGMDSVGWWGYSPESENPTVILPNQTPVDINNNTTAAYEAIKAVNTEVAAFGSIYKTYNWQGVIMSSPNKGSNFFGSYIGRDAQYEAFNMVKSESLLSKYMLTAENTNSFSSISGSGSNYVVGVLKDNNNNEAFAVVNYAAPKDSKTLTITFKANTIGEYIVYHAGEQKTVEITASGYTLTLAPGEGAFIMSANTTHTVTFKNWDGSVLYETTCQLNETPIYGGETPTKEGQEFAGWTPAIGAIKGDTVYTATFRGLPVVTFKNWDGTVLQESEWAMGATPIYSGATPTKAGYEFTGWTPEITSVVGDAVYTATFIVKHTITYVSYDGTSSSKTEIMTGDSDKVTYIPELDGYVFKGWTLNGEAYDMNTPVTEDIILVATWYKETNDGKKVVYSNDDIAQNAIKNDFSSEVSSGKETGWDWYYDTEYLFNPSASTMNDANRLWNMATFVTYSTKNGANNISLPAINFTLYSKVDFGVTAAIDTSAGAGLTDIKLNGVSCGGYEYRLISVAEENGKYYATVYKVNEGNVLAKVELTNAMAKGQEPLTLTVEANGSAYAWIKISELHMTTSVLDYMSKVDDALIVLENNPEDEAALEEYFENVAYMTAYEKENNPIPNTVLVAQEYAYYNAIVNTAGGSAEQVTAIKEYSSFLNQYPGTRNEAHIAEINAIINANFYELEEKIVDNIPNGWWSSNETLGGFKTAYTSTAQKTFDSGSYDGTAVLPAINYNLCAEVYFGLYAVAAAESWDPYNGVIGIITINGVSFVGVDPMNGNGYYFKITIANGVLTMVNEKDNSVALTVALPEAVLNGTESLTIDFNFGYWAKAEITEMHVTAFKLSEETFGNTPNGWWSSNEHLSGFETTYSTTAQMTFESGTNYNGTAVLPVFNYNSYEEVYFGLYAVAAAESWDPYNGVIGTITINGVSFVGIDPQTGDCYFKVTIANGVLTMVNEKNGSVALTVALPEGVLNGTESLTIDFDFGYWAKAEITEMHGCGKILINPATGIINNIPNGWWSSNEHLSGFETTYSATAQKTFDGGNYDGTAILAATNYNLYTEVYFGLYAVAAAESWDPYNGVIGIITINGVSFAGIDPMNGNGYYFKITIANGVLTMVNEMDDSVALTVVLSEAVLNGTESLTIDFNFGYWAKVEVTEMHTVSYVENIE